MTTRHAKAMSTTIGPAREAKTPARNCGACPDQYATRSSKRTKPPDEEPNRATSPATRSTQTKTRHLTSGFFIKVGDPRGLPNLLNKLLLSCLVIFRLFPLQF